jgi:MFS family permease
MPWLNRGVHEAASPTTQDRANNRMERHKRYSICSVRYWHVLPHGRRIFRLLLRKPTISTACLSFSNMNQKIASFATDTIHIPYTQSVNLVIVLNGVGLVARIVPGFIADRYTGVLNLFVPILALNAILLLCWLSVHSIGSFYAWTVMYGIAAGMFQSLFPTAVTSLGNDMSKAGTRLGMAFSVIGFAALVGGPIGGALLGAGNGNYDGPIIWAALSTIFGGTCIASARVHKYGFVLRVKC